MPRTSQRASSGSRQSSTPPRGAAASGPAQRREGPFNFITVTISHLPGPPHEVNLDGGRTVMDAIKAAGLSYNRHQIRVNGTVKETTSEIKEGDRIFLCGQIEGN